MDSEENVGENAPRIGSRHLGILIIKRLLQGPATQMDLCAVTGAAQNSISGWLGELYEGGLIDHRILPRYKQSPGKTQYEYFWVGSPAVEPVDKSKALLIDEYTANFKNRIVTLLNGGQLGN